MKIIKLQGGLGNQMFQYAFGKAVASLGQKIYYDISWYSKEHKETARRNFDLEVPLTDLKFCRFLAFSDCPYDERISFYDLLYPLFCHDNLSSDII